MADLPVKGQETFDEPHANTGSKEADGALTLVAVFENVTGAQSCANALQQRGVQVSMLSRKDDGPEEGIRPGNVITGPGYGLSAEDHSPPKDAPMGSGVAVGATIGATVGLLAANWAVPGVAAPLAAAGSLVSTLAGAGVGSFLGGLSEYATSEKADEDDASMFAGQVRHGGVILLARTTREQADEVRGLISFWNPLELRIQ